MQVFFLLTLGSELENCLEFGFLPKQTRDRV